MNFEKACDYAQKIISELEKVIVGQERVLFEITAALFSRGHALIEGVPGTGKTLLVKSLSHITGCQFNRVQFTPDLMPSDIIGVNVFDMAEKKFSFRQGPVFTDIFLADEINRAPAKTQSALLEAMQEYQCTVDGIRYPLSQVFSVFATQNPIEFEGTYPLPEAQVDRFMMKILVDYPQQESELRILDHIEQGFDPARLETMNLTQVLTLDEVIEIRGIVRSVRCDDLVRRYINQVIRATRTMPQITIGASPRAGVMLLLAAKAYATLQGRNFVTPDDVKEVAMPVLRHRITLIPEIEIEGKTPDDCLTQIFAGVEVPRS